MITLREFEPARDGAALREWVGGSRAGLVTWAGTTFDWPLDDAQLAGYAADARLRKFAATETATGATVGHFSLGVPPGGGETRLGRVMIAPEARGRGLARAMLTELVRYAFEDLRVPSLTLGVYTHNTRARHLYESLGFRTHRVLADCVEVDGTPWTALEMRLTAPGPTAPAPAG
ncbi:GNAT family N-acetyltransferase [Streptomyces sp. NPDC101118]|uniref:GNAT family N-acetyltransferase n=1 Tax=Streptomyces sp. NPDC101118 TaxID=3366109 RepID=UPI003805F380